LFHGDREGASSSHLKMQVHLRDLANTLHLEGGRGRGKTTAIKSLLPVSLT
jgi:hypothetical protein